MAGFGYGTPGAGWDGVTRPLMYMYPVLSPQALLRLLSLKYNGGGCLGAVLWRRAVRGAALWRWGCSGGGAVEGDCLGDGAPGITLFLCR